MSDVLLSGNGIRFAFDTEPAFGSPVSVCDGIWWLRLPLSNYLDHVNVYLLEDNSSFTLVDTGSNTAETRLLYERFCPGFIFEGKPIDRVLVTHHHPDHIGLAGWIASNGATVWATRSCWLHSKLLRMDHSETPCREQLSFFKKAGLDGLPFAAYERRPPSNYPNLVAPLPYHYRRLKVGDVLHIGPHMWRVHIANGHAAGHVILQSDSSPCKLAITGDQIMPTIATNQSVHPSEPHADPVAETLAAYRSLAQTLDDEELCLPGHGLPFRGAKTRCIQSMHSLEATLNRLLDALSKPKSAMECLPLVHRRTIANSELISSLSEMVGFINHLTSRGLVRPLPSRDGIDRWVRTSSNPPDWSRFASVPESLLIVNEE